MDIAKKLKNQLEKTINYYYYHGLIYFIYIICSCLISFLLYVLKSWLQVEKNKVCFIYYNIKILFFQ